jgi:hypothetical protein
VLWNGVELFCLCFFHLWAVEEPAGVLGSLPCPTAAPGAAERRYSGMVSFSFLKEDCAREKRKVDRTAFYNVSNA